MKLRVGLPDINRMLCSNEGQVGRRPPKSIASSRLLALVQPGRPIHTPRPPHGENAALLSVDGYEILREVVLVRVRHVDANAAFSETLGGKLEAPRPTQCRG